MTRSEPLYVSDDELIERAARAYYRRFGKQTMFHSASASTVRGDTVTLRNGNGVLARYRLHNDGRLRMLPD